MMLKSHIRDAHWLTKKNRRCSRGRLPLSRPRVLYAAAPHLPPMKLLKDPQTLLFYLLYAAIQLTIYAATFWLPTIIRQMGSLSDFQVGMFNAIAGLIAMAGMHGLRCCRRNGALSRPGWAPRWLLQRARRRNAHARCADQDPRRAVIALLLKRSPCAALGAQGPSINSSETRRVKSAAPATQPPATQPPSTTRRYESTAPGHRVRNRSGPTYRVPTTSYPRSASRAKRRR